MSTKSDLMELAKTLNVGWSTLRQETPDIETGAVREVAVDMATIISAAADTALLDAEEVKPDSKNRPDPTVVALAFIRAAEYCGVRLQERPKQGPNRFDEVAAARAAQAFNEGVMR